MTTLVVAEHDNQSLRPVTLVVAAAAEAIGNGFDVLVAGSGCGPVAGKQPPSPAPAGCCWPTTPPTNTSLPRT